MKIDEHTDKAWQGSFAHLTVCIDLRKSLVSKININGRLQIIEYEACEALLNECFKCCLLAIKQIYVQVLKSHRWKVKQSFLI